MKMSITGHHVEVTDALRAYLGAEFAGGRHANRLEKIARLEQD